MHIWDISFFKILMLSLYLLYVEHGKKNNLVVAIIFKKYKDGS